MRGGEDYHLQLGLAPRLFLSGCWGCLLWDDHCWINTGAAFAGSGAARGRMALGALSKTTKALSSSEEDNPTLRDMVQSSLDCCASNFLALPCVSRMLTLVPCCISS
jgi:hypothetical protein